MACYLGGTKPSVWTYDNGQPKFSPIFLLFGQEDALEIIASHFAISTMYQTSKKLKSIFPSTRWIDHFLFLF